VHRRIKRRIDRHGGNRIGSSASYQREADQPGIVQGFDKITLDDRLQLQRRWIVEGNTPPALRSTAQRHSKKRSVQ
jgi:hypothetical protein